MRINTKFDIGGLVTEKDVPSGFKNCRVTLIEIWTDNAADELINYTVEGRKDSLLEHELEDGSDCRCGTELSDEDVKVNERDAQGYLMCEYCVEEKAENERDAERCAAIGANKL